MKIVKSIGLVIIGVLLGGLVTFLLLDKENSNDSNALLSDSIPLSSSQLKKIDSVIIPSEPKVKIVKEIVYVDTSYQVKTDTLKGDTLTVNIDTLNADLDSVKINGEDFVIEKEQLISKSDLVLIYHEQQKLDSLDPLLDSLLIKMNVKKNTKKSSINLELWKSPLGITGYRFTESGLMIYGLFSEAILAVHKYKQELYFLETSNGWYRLRVSSELNTFNLTSKPQE